MLNQVWPSRAVVILLAILSVASLLNAQSSPTPPLASGSPSPQVSPSVPTDSTTLELVSGPPPDYPLEAAAKGLQGRVVIQLHISTEGNVTSTEILEGDRVLGEAAETAMKEWKFRPFIKGGAAVRISRKMPFDFVLHGSGCMAVEEVMQINSEHHRDKLVPQETMEGKLIHRVEPDYPIIARMKHLQGDVVLQVKIGEDGRIADLRALCGAPELVPSSINAVKRWRYSPYMLNGVPVAVKTTIKVSFRM